MTTTAKTERLLRFRVVRRLAISACAEFGIKATRVSPAFFEDLETAVTKIIRQQAVASVDDQRKSIGRRPAKTTTT